MPTVLYPMTALALRYGAAAALGYVLARKTGASYSATVLRDDDLSGAFESAPEGLSMASSKGGPIARGRWRRSLKLGSRRAEVDAGILARIAIRWT